MNLEQLCSSLKESGEYCHITMIFPNGKSCTYRAVWVDPYIFSTEGVNLIAVNIFCSMHKFIDIDTCATYEIGVQPTGTLLISSQHNNLIFGLYKSKGVSSFERKAMYSKLGGFLPKQVATYKSLLLIDPSKAPAENDSLEIPF